MSVHKLGHQYYIVRWRDGGRGTPHRRRTFRGPDAKRDADRFDVAMRRAKDLGQLAAEVLGSEQTVDAFVDEWWEKYATPYLAKGTLASYAYVIERWIRPYLGQLRLRDLSRETADQWVAALRPHGAGVPTINRSLAILQGCCSAPSSGGGSRRTRSPVCLA